MTGLQALELVAETSAPYDDRSERHSMPRVGQPFTTEAARWNCGVLRAEVLLAEHLVEQDEGDPLRWIGPSRTGAIMMPAGTRAARRLIAAWLVGNLLGDLAPSSSVMAAEKWFSGSLRGSVTIPSDVGEQVRGVLAELVTRPGALEMLPYALDPVPHAYRRDLLRDPDAAVARRFRRRVGSFFTPADVVDHMVELVLERIDFATPELAVLDPAVGTGAFLRAVFAGLVARGVPADDALRSLHGVDLDECCVDMSAFVLLTDWLRLGSQPQCPIAELWQGIRNQLLAGNTLSLLSGMAADDPKAVTPGAPAWASRRFTALVGNPPYARLGDENIEAVRGRYRSLQAATSATDMYLAFAELLTSQLRPGGAGSLVIPLSVAYSSSRAPRLFRETACQAGGEWHFQFFDRTPDALFGDDIKQRSAIVTRVAVPGMRVFTGPVMRWSSRSRHRLFDSIPRIDIGDHALGPGVPKLGTQQQLKAFTHLRQMPHRLQDDLVAAQVLTPPISVEDASTIYVAGTAYNWLSVYREASAITTGSENPSRSGVLALKLESPALADATYAILCSRLAYWLWRVEGDAFHVPSGWVKRFPINVDRLGRPVVGRLTELGVALWQDLIDHPVVSLNGGRTTISYCPHQQPHLLDQIDAELVSSCGLPDDFSGELARFVQDLATAGRDATSGHGLNRALAAWKAS